MLDIGSLGLPWKKLESPDLQQVHFRLGRPRGFPVYGLVKEIKVDLRSQILTIIPVVAIEVLGQDGRGYTFPMARLAPLQVLSSGMILITVESAHKGREANRSIQIYCGTDNPLVTHLFPPQPGLTKTFEGTHLKPEGGVV